jgi:MFS family permease
MYFGWRRFLGGLLGLLGAALVRIILAPDFALGFPDNYAVLFFIGCLTTLVMVGSFSFVLEPRGVTEPRTIHAGKEWRATLAHVVRDRNYVRYLMVRVAIALASAALPFYTVYARRVLKVSGSDLGVYLMGSALAGVLSNLALGRLGDRYGNRLLVRLAALTAALTPASALFLAYVDGRALDQGFFFTLVFVLQGLHATAHTIGSNNYLLELGPAAERVTYVSLANGVIGLAVLASPVGGATVDWVGFEALFALSLGCGIVALGLSIGLGEPRENRAATQ